MLSGIITSCVSKNIRAVHHGNSHCQFGGVSWALNKNRYTALHNTRVVWGNYISGMFKSITELWKSTICVGLSTTNNQMTPHQFDRMGN